MNKLDFSMIYFSAFMVFLIVLLPIILPATILIECLIEKGERKYFENFD